ncbi:MAG: DNA sulfur modification protein DndD [Prevotella sp.]|jgi:DNA sulfur modification protein DndD|nr:DNA sulfur modification protein DndD [Prevotella sp.]
MIIHKIKLYNFKIYKGEVCVDLNMKKSRNVIIIFGENGFGKTTFLQSLLWCLYGKMIIDIDDSIKRTINNMGYKTFLDSNLNNSVMLGSNKEKIYSVEIEFTGVSIPSVPCQSLIIKRSYNYNTKVENIDVQIDGHENELAKQIGYDLFINDFILNKDIARLFFFDSERIVSIAEEQSASERYRLSSAYNQVLGVKKYEDLKLNLLNLKQKYTKSALSEREKELYEKLNKIIANLESEIDLKKSQVNSETSLIVEKKEKFNLFSARLLKEGSNISVEELNNAVKEKAESVAYNIQIRKKLNNFLELAPFAIAGGLLKITKDVVEHDHRVEQSKQNCEHQDKIIDSIRYNLSRFIDESELKNNCRKDIKSGITKILSQYTGKVVHEDILLQVDQDEYDEFMSVYHHLSGTYQIELNNLIDDYKQNKIGIEKLNKKIHQSQVEANDYHIQELKSQTESLRIDIENSEQKITILNQQIGGLISQLGRTKESFNKYYDKVKALETDVKKSKLVDELIDELSTFLKALKDNKKSALESRIKNILNRLMHKEDLIQDIRIEESEKGLDIRLIGNNSNIIETSALSKGEQQLYVSSLLQALVEESKIEFPVFIDSPLQKFDEKHAHTIITDFYPKISKQVVLFPIADKELTESEYKLLEPICSGCFKIVNTKEGSLISKI